MPLLHFEDYPPLAKVINLRKQPSSECHPVLVTGSNELPEGPFLESIGFIFRFRDKPGTEQRELDEVNDNADRASCLTL